MDEEDLVQEVLEYGRYVERRNEAQRRANK